MTVLILFLGMSSMFGLLALAWWMWVHDPQWPSLRRQQAAKPPAPLPVEEPAVIEGGPPTKAPQPIPNGGSTEIFDPAVFAMLDVPSSGDSTQILSDMMLQSLPPQDE